YAGTGFARRVGRRDTRVAGQALLDLRVRELVHAAELAQYATAVRVVDEAHEPPRDRPAGGEPAPGGQPPRPRARGGGADEDAECGNATQDQTGCGLVADQDDDASDGQRRTEALDQDGLPGRAQQPGGAARNGPAGAGRRSPPPRWLRRMWTVWRL